MANVPRMPRNRAFQRLWIGTAAANLADGIVLAAAPLLAAAITHDPVLVSGLVVAQRVPWFAFTLLSGALVDRRDRRALLVAANVARACALGVLAISLSAGVKSLPILYATVFALGMAETIEDTAALAVLPAIVPREQLERANAQIYTAQSLLNDLIGPPLGGVLFAVAAVAAFATGAAAFAVAGIALAALPLARPAHQDAPIEPMLAAIGEGFRWFWGNRLIRIVALMSGAVNMFTFAAIGVLVLFAEQRLGLDARGYGLLIAGGAVGGVAGGLLADRLVRLLGSGPTIFLSNLLPGLALVGLGATRSPAVAAAMLAVDSFTAMPAIVVVVTLRQAGVPDRLIGRVTSAYRMIAIGALPVGALLGGVLARRFGLSAPFYAGGAALAVLAFALLPVLTTSAIDRANGSLVETKT